MKADDPAAQAASNLPLAQAALARGVAASRANDTPTALANFREACALAPEAGMPQFLLGSEYAAAGDLQAAEACLANAVLLSPELAVARYQLGLLQFSSGRAAAALVSWQPLMQQPDTTPWPHWVRGFSALAQDLFAPARAHFEQGLALNDTNPALNDDVRKILRAIDTQAPDSGGARSPASESAGLDAAQHGTIDAMLANYAHNRQVH